MGTSSPPILRLYVFTDFCPDYKGGLAVAIARNEIEAKSLIKEEIAFDIDEWGWGDLEIHPINTKFAAAVPGGA